jgi:hypothetical protein
MKTVSVSTRSKVLRELLRLAQGTDVIVQSSNGARFFLTRITSADTFYISGADDDFDAEIAATRENRRLMKFLDERGEKAKGHKGTPVAEVRRQLNVSSQ